MSRFAVSIVGLLLTMLLPGCGRQQADYPAGTPAQTIDSAQAMIADGHASRLVELVYAEDEQSRSFLNQVGVLLGSVQSLADAVQRRFPEELEQFRREAEQEGAGPLFARLVASGRPSTNREFGVSQIDRRGLTLDTGTRPGRPSRRDPRMSDSQREVVNDVLKQLLADPYRWLEQGREKIGATPVTDDTVAITWEGRPVFPPFGLVLIRREGRWWLVPPTSYPVVRRMMPRSEDEWFVWGSMVKTFDHVVTDLTNDVESGRVKNLTDLADSAVEKAAIPSMLVFFAYSNLVEQREKEAAEKNEAGTPGPASDGP